MRSIPTIQLNTIRLVSPVAACRGLCLLGLLAILGCGESRQDELIDRSVATRTRLNELSRRALESARRLAKRDRWSPHARPEAVGPAAVDSGAGAESPIAPGPSPGELAEARRSLQAVQQSLRNAPKADVIERETAANDEVLNSPVPVLFRSIEGLDQSPVLIGDADEQQDLFFQTVLNTGDLPATLQDVLDKIHAQDPGLTRNSFLVGEGSQIPVTLEKPLTFNRNFRFVITWSRENSTEILLGTPAGARAGFLEVMSWDPEKHAFNYYERQQDRDTLSWIWKGDSSHALAPATRGQGCFRCHINGSPIMRELDRPWNNWHSEAVTITSTVPDEIRREQPRKDLFRNAGPAQNLETQVRDGIRRWNSERLRRSINGETIRDVAEWTRQLVTTSTVNLVSSQTKSDVRQAIDPAKVDLPPDFFLNHGALRRAISRDLPRLDNRVERPHYEAALLANDVHLQGDARDTYFAFLVPGPSAEDSEAIATLIERELIAPKVVASFLMVDFPNPIYSAKRASLFELIKDITDGRMTRATGSDLTGRIVAAIRAGAPPLNTGTGSLAEIQALPAAQQFLFYVDLPDAEWEERMISQVSEYFGAVSSRLATAEGVNDYIKLAIARRSQFARVLPGSIMIQESNILFPRVSGLSSDLMMGVDGLPKLP